MKKFILSITFCFLTLSFLWGQETNDESRSIKEIQSNTVFIELGGLGVVVSANYERLVPMSNKTGLGFRVGAGTAGQADTAYTATTFTVLAEINLLYGKSKHFLETGVGFNNIFVQNDTEQLVSLKLGYRYQAPKGFLIKLAPMYIYNFEKINDDDVFDGIWFGAGIGYSF